MEYNFFSLPNEDILFLMNRLDSLSLNSRMRLVMNKNKIMDSINESYEDLYKPVPVLFGDSLYKKAETIEDILLSINNFKTKSSSLPQSEMVEVFSKFYYEILKDKIDVYSVVQKAIPDNDTLDDILNNSLKSVYQLFISDSDIYVSAIATGMFYKALSIDDRNLLEFLAYSIDVLKGYNANDIMNIIDKYNTSGLLSFNNNINNIPNIQQQPAENFEEVNIIGDNLFEDRPQFIHDLRNEILKLDKDSIRRYIGNYDNISFMIDEQSLAFIIKSDDFKVAKVSVMDIGLFTIVKYQDNLYLLFEIIGDKTIQGISFPVEDGGKRKIIVLSKDDNIQYFIKEPTI